MIFDVRQNFLLYISVLILSTDFYPFFQKPLHCKYSIEDKKKTIPIVLNITLTAVLSVSPDICLSIQTMH